MSSVRSTPQARLPTICHLHLVIREFASKRLKVGNAPVILAAGRLACIGVDMPTPPACVYHCPASYLTETSCIFIKNNNNKNQQQRLTRDRPVERWPHRLESGCSTNALRSKLPRSVKTKTAKSRISRIIKNNQNLKCQSKIASETEHHRRGTRNYTRSKELLSLSYGAHTFLLISLTRQDRVERLGSPPVQGPAPSSQQDIKFQWWQPGWNHDQSQPSSS